MTVYPVPSPTVLGRILDDNPAAVALLTPELRVSWCNSACLKMLEDLRLPGSSFADIIFGDEVDASFDMVARLLPRLKPGGTALRNVLLSLRSDAMRDPLWKRVTTSVEQGSAGEALWLAVTLVDAAQPAPATVELRASTDNWRRIVDDTPVGICITSHHGMFEFANPAYLAFYDYPREELIGRHFTLVVPERLREVLSDAHDRFIAGAGEIRGEWTVVGRSGEERVILADATRIVDEQGNPKKVTFIIDISQRKKLEQELELKTKLLERLSTVDPLTGVYNRRHGDAVLDREISRSNRSGEPLCVALIDIDRFKAINDRFGHTVGDDVLVAASTAFRAAFRDSDTLARYGGEEFLVIFPQTDSRQAIGALHRARTEVVEHCRALVPDPVTFSAGLTNLQLDESGREMLSRADRLLYQAKADGRDRVISDQAHGS